MAAYDNFTFSHKGRNFIANLHYDEDATPPWKRSDRHGEVTDWVTRDKKPGEWILHSDRGSKRFYDHAGAIATAKRDGWGLSEEDKTKLAERLGYLAGPVALTKGEITAEAVRRDFEFLRTWCTDQWFYCGVCVQEVDRDGNAIGDEYEHALWGIESDNDEYLREVATELADQWPDLMEIKPGLLVRTVEGETDSDENDNERKTPAGAVGRITDEAGAAGSWNVVFPNGAWVILEDAELRDVLAYELIAADSEEGRYWLGLFPSEDKEVKAAIAKVDDMAEWGSIHVSHLETIRAGLRKNVELLKIDPEVIEALAALADMHDSGQSVLDDPDPAATIAPHARALGDFIAPHARALGDFIASHGGV